MHRHLQEKQPHCLNSSNQTSALHLENYPILHTDTKDKQLELKLNRDEPYRLAAAIHKSEFSCLRIVITDRCDVVIALYIYTVG